MDHYMRKVFGKKACKVPIDAGFTCPNRDGTKGVGGCAFCSASGSGDFTAGRSLGITEQITRGAEMMQKKVERRCPYSILPVVHEYLRAARNTKGAIRRGSFSPACRGYMYRNPSRLCNP